MLLYLEVSDIIRGQNSKCGSVHEHTYFPV